MQKLIQTSKCSIIYGTHRGKENQELFRCPRTLDNTDIPSYVDRHRALLGFEDDDTEDLRSVEGYTMVGYFRMYYRNGWAGRWMNEFENGPDKAECAGTQNIVDWICETFERGCNFAMKEYFQKNHKPWEGDQRYLLKPMYGSLYKVMIDTTYGNGDYPVRIYAYRKNSPA